MPLVGGDFGAPLRAAEKGFFNSTDKIWEWNSRERSGRCIGDADKSHRVSYTD